ncbi:MAG: cyclic nucleotide-binding domain-containing protein [Deltaproteobacteria bacterium]
MELQSFLKSIEIISDLPDDDINLIAENAHLMDFADGAVIIARGEPGRFLWIVYEGEVEVLLTGDDGSKSTIATLERTQVFGEMSILTGEPAVLDVIASGAAKLLRIPRDIFSRFIADNPKTLGKFTRLVTKRMLRNEQDDAQIRLKNICKENEDPYDLNFSSCADPLKILTVNCGSSSLKYTLFDTTKNEPVLEGLIEKIGSGDASYMIKTTDVKKEQPAKDVMAIEEAFRMMVATVSDKNYTGITDLDEIKAIGHRVVHGGGLNASGIGPPGPMAGRRPPLIRTSAINASGSSGLWFHCILE